jgi:subtilisin family serine protease
LDRSSWNVSTRLRVAVIDSGIAAHDALAGKVVAAASIIPGDPDVDDAYGHGTHIADIARSAQAQTPEYSGGIALLSVIPKSVIASVLSKSSSTSYLQSGLLQFRGRTFGTTTANQILWAIGC